MHREYNNNIFGIKSFDWHGDEFTAEQISALSESLFNNFSDAFLNSAKPGYKTQQTRDFAEIIHIFEGQPTNQPYKLFQQRCEDQLIRAGRMLDESHQCKIRGIDGDKAVPGRFGGDVLSKDGKNGVSFYVAKDWAVDAVSNKISVYHIDANTGNRRELLMTEIAEDSLNKFDSDGLAHVASIEYDCCDAACLQLPVMTGEVTRAVFQSFEVANDETGLFSWIDAPELDVGENPFFNKTMMHMQRHIYDNFANQLDDELKELIIPDGTTFIPDDAFLNMHGLESVTVPDSVYKIGNHAFGWDYDLKSINFGEDSQLSNLGEGICINCEKLEFIELPENVTYVSKSMFQECRSLSDVYFRGTVTDIDESAFFNTNITNIDLSSVTNVHARAFAECDKLATIIMPKSHWYCDEYAFAGDKSLTSINLDDCVLEGRGVFESCEGLISVDMTNYRGIDIPPRTFDGCVNLREVKWQVLDDEERELYLPYIGAYAFDVHAPLDKTDPVPDFYKLSDYAFGDKFAREDFEKSEKLKKLFSGACDDFESRIVRFVDDKEDGRLADRELGE